MVESRIQTYQPATIGNEFIRRNNSSTNAGSGLDIMKMLKLSFFAHGWYLALYNKPLLEGRIEAWPYGPVCVEMYQHFRHQGVSINRECEDVPMGIDEKARAVVDAVWEKYKGHHSYHLSDITHQEGSPWTTTVKKHGLYAKIDDDMIKQYYEGIISKR